MDVCTSLCYTTLLNCEWFLTSGWSVLVQFAGYRTTLTFLRKDVSLGCAAQLSTKRIICLFCAPICTSKEWRKEQKICHHPCFTVHMVFSWQFFNVLEASWFRGFPNHNRHLSLPSLLTHSSTVSLSFECFPPWQDSPLYAKVLSGSTLKNSPVSSALYTSCGS